MPPRPTGLSRRTPSSETGRVTIHAKGFGIPHAKGFIQRDPVHAKGFIQRDSSHAKGFIPPSQTRIAGRPPENRDKIGGVTNKRMDQA